ncbi:uncharacterized protein LOC128675143 isoform X2 [Plodia interpunctella]|uniref:uncharacterized protein LOC128675143 isoform X2 n=1 Tax=Plodia interpunctella TaxID=58824 RepID=UPI002367D8A1|nr:uncharacterized protein LOC128675143 isoform X2 [Plodia interpunctella]XP_053610295.1 uncharacterized protein LOC128675143 isoform X2 [Plodia interpunctella]XP_053610296.1 uncharacterized protein LOC128675143 isoform X2 [Plodia interpunctella]XP_053610297.1 uncharacterized protein LOC128675143 isoform X2 [Plodia interpunctella]
MTWDVTLDFEYVVTKKAPPRIAFGTGLDREVLPTKGPAMSPFMRRALGETRDNLGPGSHNPGRDAFYDLTHRKYSKWGLGAKTSRWKVIREYQPPPRKPPKPKPLKKNCAAFNSTSKRKGIFKVNDYPAACDYVPVYKKREMKFAYSFTGPKFLRCAVEIKCVPYNLDACGYCGCSCSAQGDYWQFEDRIFLCRMHYNMLFSHCLAKFQGAKLAEFKSVRDCFFAHAHNSCKAALKIMTIEEITKKLRKEAYLDLYFPQRRFCNN